MARASGELVRDNDSVLRGLVADAAMTSDGVRIQRPFWTAHGTMFRGVERHTTMTHAYLETLTVSVPRPGLFIRSARSVGVRPNDGGVAALSPVPPARWNGGHWHTGYGRKWCSEHVVTSARERDESHAGRLTIVDRIAPEGGNADVADHAARRIDALGWRGREIVGWITEVEVHLSVTAGRGIERRRSGTRQATALAARLGPRRDPLIGMGGQV